MPTVPEAELLFVQRLILRCVREAPGRFPRSGLAKLLVGSNSRQMQELHDHRFYGRLRRYRRRDVLHHVDVLLQQGYLAPDEDEHVIPVPVG